MYSSGLLKLLVSLRTCSRRDGKCLDKNFVHGLKSYVSQVEKWNKKCNIYYDY